MNPKALLLDWPHEINEEGKSTWPPSQVQLGDSVDHDVLMSQISGGDRGKRWQEDFCVDGTMGKTRPNRLHAAKSKRGLGDSVYDQILIDEKMSYSDSEMSEPSDSCSMRMVNGCGELSFLPKFSHSDELGALARR